MRAFFELFPIVFSFRTLAVVNMADGMHQCEMILILKEVKSDFSISLIEDRKKGKFTICLTKLENEWDK